jgi:hypothetical protein
MTCRRKTASIFLSCVLLAMIVAGVEAAPLSREEIVDLFANGKELFRKANELSSDDPEAALRFYQEAALRFERIAGEGGIRNGKLYYNIGNAHFRMGDIGRAILYYRKAEPLMPNDVNLHQNLRFAREQRIDRIEEKQETKVLKTLFFWHYDLTTRARLYLLAAFFAVFWLSASARLFVLERPLRWGLVVSGVVMILLLGSVVVDYVSKQRSPAGVIVAGEVTARKGDGVTYQPSFKEPLHSGTEFEIVEERTGWLHIELADGRRSWIPEKSAAVIGE